MFENRISQTNSHIIYFLDPSILKQITIWQFIETNLLKRAPQVSKCSQTYFCAEVVKGPSLLDVVPRCIGTTYLTTFWEGLKLKFYAIPSSSMKPNKTTINKKLFGVTCSDFILWKKYGWRRDERSSRNVGEEFYRKQVSHFKITNHNYCWPVLHFTIVLTRLW